MTGQTVFIAVFTAGTLLILAGLIWSLLLGIRINKTASGSRDIHEGSFDIRGTVEDTKIELEKHIRALYKEPMEITQSDDSVSFIRVEPQPFIRSLKTPFEKISFTVSVKNSEIVRITHSTRLQRFRKNIMKTVIAILLFISVPAVILIWWFVTVHVMPMYDIQGDIIPSIRFLKKQLFQTIHMVHVIWPPFLLLFLYTSTIRNITREYQRIFRNIEVIQ